MKETKTIELSILIPIYGVEKYIERCIRSLFIQDLEEVEFIFVNDCTKDHSMEILEKTLKEYPHIKSNIKIFQHTKNEGLASARLTGLMHSTGKYIWFVDSDDYIAPYAIETILSNLDGETDMISFNYAIDNGTKIENQERKKLSINNILSFKSPHMLWLNVYKRTLFTKNNIYPISGMDFSEDHILMSKLIPFIKKQKNISKTIYYYNTSNNTSYIHTKNIKHMEQYIDGAINIYEFYLKHNLINKHKIALLYMLSIKYTAAINSISKEDYRMKEIYKILQQICKPYTYIFKYAINNFPQNTIYNFLHIYRKLFIRN